MFGDKVKVQDAAAARVLAMATLMASSRGALLDLPRDNEYGGGYTLWTGLITSLADAGHGGRASTAIKYMDGLTYTVYLPRDKVAKMIEEADGRSGQRIS